MALRVWLPLNGNLENKGLSNTKFINKNDAATVENAGKIGKCYSFNATDTSNCIYTTDFNLNTNFTMCLWAKPTGLNSNAQWLICLNDNSGTATEIQGGLYFRQSNITYSAGVQGIYSISLVNNTWYHVALTKEGSNVSLYLNGELVSSLTDGTDVLKTNLTIGARANNVDGAGTSSYGHYTGLINDVRIYDECLSSKEIKEISKGLVAHYKLNNLDFINTDVSGNGYNTTSVGILTLNNESPRYDKSAIFTGSQLLNVSIGNVLANSKDFTISGWFYHTGGTCYYAGDNANAITVALEKNRFFIYDSSGTAHVGTWSATDNIWQYLTLVHNSAAQTLTLYINGVQNQQISTNGTVYSKEVLNIGGRKNTGQFQGYMSDLRFYVTALSANDVKQLYEASAIIDNKGNSYSYEFIEEE